MKRGKTMEQNVKFNYFMNLFRKKFNDRAEKIGFEKLNREDFLDCLQMGDLYATFPLNKERLSIYEEVLPDICKTYMLLTDTFIENTEDAFGLVKQILDTMTDNPYKDSFLWFISMFFKTNLYVLGKGDPLLFYTLGSSKNSQFQVTLDRNYQIRTCEAINMDKVEEAKTMVRILTLEKNNQIGPVSNVNYIYRKDI